MDNFFCKLQDADYSLLERYFSTHWEKPVYCYSPFWVFREVFLIKRKYKQLNRQIAVELKFDESFTPVICIRDDKKILEYQFIALKKQENVCDFLQNIKNSSSARLILRVPDFTPLNDRRFKLIQTSKQMIYDCEGLTRSIENDLNDCTYTILKEKSSRYALRKNLRECSYRRIECDDSPYIKQVLNLWKQGKSPSYQSSVNLEKDLFSIPWAVNNSFNNKLLASIGFRGSLPVSYSFVVRLPGFNNLGSQMIAKSLNYKSLLGGYNETSVWELYQCCKACLESGIEYLNANGYSSNLSLKKFKERFAVKDLEFEAYDWIFAHS